MRKIVLIIFVIVTALTAVSCAKPKDGVVGATGPAGSKGDLGNTPVNGISKIIDPCGDATGIYDEVFLLLSDGMLLWSLSDSASGNNTRFSVAVDGNWVTTDGSNCSFTISTIGNQRTISWTGGFYTWVLQ